MALALVWILAAGWLRERRTAEVMRLNNEVMRLNTEGAVLAKQGRNEEARKTLLSVLELDPDNAAALGNLATVEMKLGYDEAALVHAQAAVRASPKEAVYHYKLGNLLALKKRYEEALLSLQQAIEIDPHYANAYNELGDIYLELDRPTEARKAFEDGLRCDPTPAARLSSPEDLRTLAKLHKNLARAALAEGHPEEAIHHLETALPLYSPAESAGKAEATYWLATAYAKAGRTTEACVALRKFEVLSPGLLSELAEKATLLMKQERCTRGLD